MNEPLGMLLASQSPRRCELLTLLGWDFSVAPAEVDETVRPAERPGDYVRRLAVAKAEAVTGLANPGWLVVGSDTAVVDGDEILGKPVDNQAAVAMLHRLRGRSHQVFSAVAVIESGTGRTHSDVCVTDVPMRAYRDEEIHAYVATGDPLDKAGAYAIQHRGFRPVTNLAGCFANVMGLPLCHLVRTMREFGLAPSGEVPNRCQGAIQYQCPVYGTIL
jgi:MAF protein